MADELDTPTTDDAVERALRDLDTVRDDDAGSEYRDAAADRVATALRAFAAARAGEAEPDHPDGCECRRCADGPWQPASADDAVERAARAWFESSPAAGGPGAYDRASEDMKVRVRLRVAAALAAARDGEAGLRAENAHLLEANRRLEFDRDAWRDTAQYHAAQRGGEAVAREEQDLIDRARALAHCFDGLDDGPVMDQWVAHDGFAAGQFTTDDLRALADLAARGNTPAVDREALARHLFTEWRRVHPGTLTWETFGDRHRQPFYEQADVFLGFLAARGDVLAVDREALAEFLADNAGVDWIEPATPGALADAVLTFLSARAGTAPTEVEWGVRWPTERAPSAMGEKEARDIVQESHLGARLYQRTVSTWREVQP
jgi:hypothetical protein